MASKNPPSAQKITHAPIKTFRYGVLKAAVWANKVDGKTFYNVTFIRSYQDTENKWHDTASFSRDDLPLVARLAEKSHEFIYETLAESKAE